MSTSEQAPPKSIGMHYKITFSDQREIEFCTYLDEETLGLIPKEQDSYPEWTKLSYCKCDNCPLDESKYERCPIASNLAEVIESFKDALSYEEVDVRIVCPTRTYEKHVALQYVLSSLIGIYMVTSGCPIMDKLRPMVATHMPFSSLEETTYRAVSMYLLAQYFLMKKGKEPDWELKDLIKIYKAVEKVNDGFTKRIYKVHIKDAGLNAVVHLNCYARFTNLLLLEAGLGDIEKLFYAYMDKPQETN